MRQKNNCKIACWANGNIGQADQKSAGNNETRMLFVSPLEMYSLLMLFADLTDGAEKRIIAYSV